MRFPRSLAVQSPSIIIASLALMFSLGGGAYAATQMSEHVAPATAAARPCTSVKLHALKLEHDWHSAQKLYDGGNPSYGICNGVVYLSGSLYQHGSTNFEFAVLPRGYRPAHDMWIDVYTYEGTSGFIIIDKSGEMKSVGGPSTTESYTSLAAISFPVNS